MDIMQNIGSYLHQSTSYNILETVIVVLGVAYWVFMIKLAFED